MRFGDLPEIVVREVLESAYAGTALEDRYKVIMALSQTSSGLRAMTLGMPRLWATIHSSICSSSIPDKNIARLGTLLTRSGQSPLTVVIETINRDGRPRRRQHMNIIIEHYLPIIRSSTVRWEVLHLNVPYREESRFVGNLRIQKFPKLEEISHDRAHILSSSSSTPQSNPPPSIQENPFLEWDLPVLKRYITKRTALPGPTHFPQLEEVTYRYMHDADTPTNHFVHTLSPLAQFSNLRSLDLTETPCSRNYVPRHPDTETEILDVPSLYLQSLQSLRISFIASSFAKTQLWDIFKEINTPNLRSLGIAYKNIEDTDIPVLLRACAEGTRFNFPVLQQLAIELTRNNVHLPDLFTNLPATSTLQEFRLQSSYISPEGCEFPLGCPIKKIVLSRCNLTAEDVIRGMTSHQEAEGDTPAPPLPTILDGDPIVFA